jgi:heptosyltransferase-2
MESRRLLVVQTAFLGDVILTLPLIQVLKRTFPQAEIDVVVIPGVADILKGHPAISKVIAFDKRGRDKGIGGLLRTARELRRNDYSAGFVPHRSLRSALLVRLAGIPERIGFNTSAGRMFLTSIVRYDKNIHEHRRNLRLLSGYVNGSEIIELGKDPEYPTLHPSTGDREVVDRFLTEHTVDESQRLIAIAPGTVWNTKRWLQERFSELTKMLLADGYRVALVGSKADEDLCRGIANAAADQRVFSAAGELSVLQSAEMIRRCMVLVSNDSAPVHIAVAMRTPVVAIFGATVPAFGFAPYGENDSVVEVNDLPCRPCSIHGGDKCPIKTFDCMVRISAQEVYRRAQTTLERIRTKGGK